jgi:hypothetical protein
MSRVGEIDASFCCYVRLDRIQYVGIRAERASCCSPVKPDRCCLVSSCSEVSQLTQIATERPKAFMKRYVRLISEFAGTSDEPSSKDFKVIINCLLDGESLVRQLAYGITHEEDGRYPFELRPPVNGSEFGHLCFGTSLTDEPTNIFDRPITINAIFTRWIDGEEELNLEQPYRIVNIVELLS